MMRTRILAILLPAVLIGAGLQEGVRIRFFTVQANASDLLVSWQVEEEPDVQVYELYRMTRFSNNEFVKVASIRPHGVDKAYLFRDTQVFKASSEQVDYRLDVLYLDGLREELARQRVNYASTAIRRTWGSIKAMFQ